MEILEMETWKLIDGYDNYEVSNLGRVRKIQYLNPCPDNYGYLLVCLTNKRGQSNKKVHRLVAEAFIDNPENKPTIDHINRNKTDNSISNLVWATQSENNINRRSPRSDEMRNIYHTSENTFRVRIKRLNVDKVFRTLEEAKSFRDETLLHS